MPIAKYFKGKGQKVMANMQDEYGKEKGKSVFYATAKKRGMDPESFEETPEGEKLYHGGKVPKDQSPAAESREPIHQHSKRMTIGQRIARGKK